MHAHRQSDADITRYAVTGGSGRAWEEHLPLREARRSAAHVRGEGFTNVFVVAEPGGQIVSRDLDQQGRDQADEYSVRLNGLSVWEDHLHSVTAARQSADESRAMGLSDVHVVDDTTGEVVE